MPDSSPQDQSTPPPVEAAGHHTRRTVLTVAAVAAVGAATGIVAPPALNRAMNPAKPSRWRFLTADEASLLDAVCEQIIPADQDPGAHQANVVNFIDKQLVGPYRRFQERYRQGLTALQNACQAMHKQPFQHLPSNQQTAFLKAIETSKTPASDFFRLVISHTMQGFYGSPRHGGNKDYASYKMLGLEYPRVIGRNLPKGA